MFEFIKRRLFPPKDSLENKLGFLWRSNNLLHKIAINGLLETPVVTTSHNINHSRKIMNIYKHYMMDGEGKESDLPMRGTMRLRVFFTVDDHVVISDGLLKAWLLTCKEFIYEYQKLEHPLHTYKAIYEEITDIIDTLYAISIKIS